MEARAVFAHCKAVLRHLVVKHRNRIRKIPPHEEHAQEGGNLSCGKHDHFHMVHPDTEWRTCISHAVKIGLGTDQYELVRI